MWISTFHNPHSEILERELECGFPHSIIHIPMRFSMVRSEIFSKRQVHIPHSKILERELECGFPHSIIHIPMRFSMVRSEIFSKRQVHIPHSKILERELECGFPQSTINIDFQFPSLVPAFLDVECGLWISFQIPHSTFCYSGLILGVAWSFSLTCQVIFPSSPCPR